MSKPTLDAFWSVETPVCHFLGVCYHRSGPYWDWYWEGLLLDGENHPGEDLYLVTFHTEAAEDVALTWTRRVEDICIGKAIFFDSDEI